MESIVGGEYLVCGVNGNQGSSYSFWRSSLKNLTLKGMRKGRRGKSRKGEKKGGKKGGRKVEEGEELGKVSHSLHFNIKEV